MADAPPVDWNDPCQRAAALYAAYNRILSGEQESEFEYEGNGVRRRARYTQTNLTLLQAELREAQRLCAEKTGQPNPRQRFAIQAGSRKVFP